MSQYALAEDGQEVDAESFQADAWEGLKASYKLGSYVMPCCKAPAVLKTSINGLQFFSHLSEECTTAPETIWHRNAKKSMIDAINALGIEAQDEASGVTPNGQKWRADVFFEYGSHRFAIELQHTPQTLSEFMRRQQRYVDSGIKSYWVVRVEVFRRLQKATIRQHLKRFHNGKFPENGIGTGAIPELPVAILLPDFESPMQFGELKHSTVTDWIQALLSGRFVYSQGSWSINDY